MLKESDIDAEQEIERQDSYKYHFHGLEVFFCGHTLNIYRDKIIEPHSAEPQSLWYR